MFNPQIVRDMIKHRGLKNVELLRGLGKTWNGSLDLLLKGDIRVSKIEQIADFFGVPIDTFFDRDPSVKIVYPGLGIDKAEEERLAAENQALQALLEEKDKRIKVLEEIVDLLRASSRTQ